MKKGNGFKSKNSTNGSDLNFEAQLWAATGHVELYRCRVSDPCCGSGGMFVEEDAGCVRDIVVYGQELPHSVQGLPVPE